MKEKLINFAKTHTVLSCVIGSAVAALIISLIVTAVAVSVINSAKGGDGSEINAGEVDWGKGITADIPEFSGKLQSSEGTESYAAVYYTEVTGEQASEYIALIEQECGVKFTGELYPRSAVYGDRIIAVHYSVTEMKMSVTVVRSANAQ